MNTFFRLPVLIPSAMFCAFTAWTMFDAIGPSPMTLIWTAIALIPIALVVWAIRDDRKRRALRSTFGPKA